jgi:hypothetical protein
MFPFPGLLHKDKSRGNSSSDTVSSPGLGPRSTGLLIVLCNVQGQFMGREAEGFPAASSSFILRKLSSQWSGL